MMAGNYSENFGTKSGNAPDPTIRSGNPVVSLKLRYQALIAPRPYALENDLGKDQALPRSAIMSRNSGFSVISIKSGFWWSFACRGCFYSSSSPVVVFERRSNSSDWWPQPDFYQILATFNGIWRFHRGTLNLWFPGSGGCSPRSIRSVAHARSDLVCRDRLG